MEIRASRVSRAGNVTRSRGRHRTPETPTELVDQAGALLQAYDFAGAYQLLVEVRSRIEHRVDVDPTDAVDAVRMLAEAMLALGQVDNAAEAIADLGTWSDLGPYQAAMLAVTRARLLTAQHRLEEAAACYHDIVQSHPRMRDPARWPALLAMAGAAVVTAARGRPGTAEPDLTLAYTQLVEEYGTGQVDVVRVGVELTQLRMHLGGYDAAWRLAAQLMPAAVTDLGEDHPLVAQLAGLVDHLNTERRQHERAPAPAASPSQPVQRRRHRGGRRSLAYWPSVTAVVCAATAVATAVMVVAIARLVPAREPAVATGPAASRAPWTPPYKPAGDVRIVRDTGTTIDIAWTDPTGGTRPTIVYLAKDDSPAVVAATVQAATSSVRLTGLDPRAHRYCIGVAVAYGPATTARAPDVCTSRPTSTPTIRRSTPSSSRPAARRRRRSTIHHLLAAFACDPTRDGPAHRSRSPGGDLDRPHDISADPDTNGTHPWRHAPRTHSTTTSTGAPQTRPSRSNWTAPPTRSTCPRHTPQTSARRSPRSCRPRTSPRSGKPAVSSRDRPGGAARVGQPVRPTARPVGRTGPPSARRSTPPSGYGLAAPVTR